MSLRKKSEPVERAFVVAYVRTAYPSDQVQFNARLGPIPTKFLGVDLGGMSENIYKVYNRYADAVVVQPDKLILVEGKMIDILPAIGQIMYYRFLLPKTPEFAAYAALPVEMEIVCPSPDPEIVAFAQSVGIRVVIWTNANATAYLSSALK